MQELELARKKEEEELLQQGGEGFGFWFQFAVVKGKKSAVFP